MSDDEIVLIEHIFKKYNTQNVDEFVEAMKLELEFYSDFIQKTMQPEIREQFFEDFCKILYYNPVTKNSMYCFDCRKNVETTIYNGDVTPKIHACIECGQFIHLF